MRLKQAVVVIATLDGETGKPFTSFELAEQFMEEQLVNAVATENKKSDEEWYILTKEKSFSLRYKPYED